MKRREFITLLGGTAAWPLAVRAQQTERMRRIGVLMGFNESDPIIQKALDAFGHGLRKVGWEIGRNLQVEYRWSAGSIERAKQASGELIALKPDVIFSSTTPVTAELKRATSAIPIVFVQVSDPLGAGFVGSLARPGGNLTGFINFEDGMGGKWIELLKEASPAVTHAIALFNPSTAPGAGQYFLQSFETAGGKLGVIARAAPVHSPGDIEAAIGNVAARPGGGIVVISDSYMIVHYGLVLKLTEAYKLPAVYGLSARAREGALISYAPDVANMYSRSAAYVDRILNGESPANLPVQVPTKFELIINLKTAKALGLTIPDRLLALADEVIE